jgi:hypothetical protein
MRSKIAVATVSGKAYYRLVNELKEKRLPFLSLIPGEPIPPSIRVVITTSKERPSISHSKILLYDPEVDPSTVIDEAIRISQSKEVYNELVIGVDPGKTFGIAVLGDGKVLKKEEELTIERAVDTVLIELNKNPSKVQKVKIGGGVPELAKEFLGRLEIALPKNASAEIVKEYGTSIQRSPESKKKISDADSAVKIARES